MLLSDVLQKIVDDKEEITLNDSSNKAWQAENLIETLHPVALKRDVYRHPLYIAIVNQGGYLGEVLYRIHPLSA